jgi:hydroxyacylglutathione hydrolase
MPDVVNTSEIRITRLELGPYQTNCYVLVCKASGKSLVVDAPADAQEIVKELKGSSPALIVITHNHRDHTDALLDLHSQLKVPIAIHPLDAPGLPCPADKKLNDGDVLDLGQLKIKVLHTPGHTPGSICLSVGSYLLAGDTIFPGGPGHTKTPAAFDQILKSIQDKVLTLPDVTAFYPGHGDSATLAAEKPAILSFLSRQHASGLCGDALWSST